MSITVIVSIIGLFTTVMLGVNAFFLKGILNSQTQMQIEIARLLVKVENFSGRIAELEHNLRKLELSTMECRGKCESSNIKG